jgi:hypothetical protein
MHSAAPRPRRAAGLLGVGLLAGAVLTACGGAAPRTAPAAATGPASAVPAADTPTADTSAADGAAADLAGGLLPSEAFGESTSRTPLPLDQLGGRDSLSGSVAAALTGMQVDPPECRGAIERVLAQVAAFHEGAAQLARTGETATVEALVRPAVPADAVAVLTELADACSSVTVRAGGYGNATVTVEPLDVSGLPGTGDTAAAVTVTVAADLPDGGSWSGTALAGLVQDGDRVLALAQLAPRGGPLDPASFTALLQRAYEVQAAALD